MSFLYRPIAGLLDFLSKIALYMPTASEPAARGRRKDMKLRSLLATTSAAAICLAAANALGDEPAPKTADTGPYTLFNPTPKDKMRDFSTDRPTKSNVPYTVPAGHFQYESDIFIYGYDNTSTPDTQITSWTIGNPTFKLGLLNNLDFEVNISFYNSVRAVQVSTGASSLSRGIGDTF